jgi:hypothetical protein
MHERTVNQLAAVVYNPLDVSLFLQMTDSNTGKTAIDFEPFNENALANETEGRNFLEDSVVCRFVKDNSVLRLVLHLPLRPLLLLCGFTPA